MADRDRTSRQSSDQLGDRNSSMGSSKDTDQSNRDLRDSGERMNDRGGSDRAQSDASGDLTPRLDETSGDDVGMRGRSPGRPSDERPR